MPQINVVIWNIENLGQANAFRGNWPVLAQFISNTAFNRQADVILIEELKEPAIGANVLQTIQYALNQLPPPFNNWIFDWIKGAISTTGVPPFATENDLNWDTGHHEGYVAFWNQNISKFLVSPAPPIQPPGAQAAVPNTQSNGARIQGQVIFGDTAVPISTRVPAGGIQVPNVDYPYTLPAGTTAPGQAPLANPLQVAGGTVLPVNTQIGPGGVTVNVLVGNVAPIVIPGGYILQDALMLPVPNAGNILVPEHLLSLVMFGRATGNPPSNYTGNIDGNVVNFDPAAPNFDWIYFPSGAGNNALLQGPRRPAYITLNVNRAAPNNGAADKLVPLIAYHAPAAAPASSSGMQRSAYSQPLYQAYDWGTFTWVNCGNAFLGGDFNVPLNSVIYPYNAFYLAWQDGGASCDVIVNNPYQGQVRTAQQATVAANQSMVQIRYPFGGGQIESADPEDYRSLAIDNVFAGGAQEVAPAPGILYDLPSAVSGGIAPIGVATIQRFQETTFFTQCQAFLLGQGELPPHGDMENPLLTYWEVGVGQLGVVAGDQGGTSPARRAAEFIELCVSDHLPVCFTINL